MEKKVLKEKTGLVLVVFLMLINEFANDMRILCRSDDILQGVNILMS